MSRQDRLRLIAELESKRNSKILTYITGDRRGLETKIATDVFSIIYEHLKHIGRCNAIDLFLYSTGGMTMAGWGLVNLIREFCDKFSVIIPFKAHSCATLITLGANEIIMSELGQLSPIDPSVTSPYNPPAPGTQPMGPPQLLPVPVEDVIGYLDLAKKEMELKKDSSKATAFGYLSNNVHPLALGSVYRAREQIKMLAQKLLSFHISKHQKNKINHIVSQVTKELYSHDYIIGRREAKEIIKLNIIDVDSDTATAIWNLYKEYENLLDLNTPYSPDVWLGPDESKTATFHRAVIESTERADTFITEKELRRAEVLQPGMPIPIKFVQERILKEEWAKIEE
ncbi:MAG: serine protease [candidate division Zixibacteria bacterium]|nr:serine protease [candidate division Zixibacteria bacterium]